MIPLIEFKNVSVMRQLRSALHDVSLSIQPQERVALLGPNGCGKSTFIKTITRELYPLAGPNSHAKFLGEVLSDVVELRKHLGIVSSEWAKRFDPHQTVLEIVLTGFFGHVRLVKGDELTPAIEQDAYTLLKEFDLNPLRSRLFGELSSGEAQRTLIARALAPNPNSLLLDEPTNSLDLSARRELLAHLQRVIQKGKGLVLVTHHLEDILPEIDRVILMKDGRLLADGPKIAVLTSKNLEDLFNVRLEVSEINGFYRASVL